MGSDENATNERFSPGTVLRLRRNGWLTRLLLLLVLFGPAWAVDRTLFKWSDQRHVRAGTLDFRSAARQFGEPIGIAFITLTIWIADSMRRRQLLLLVVVVLLASGAAIGLKLLIGRERPAATGGLGMWQGPQWPVSGRPDPGFPSGHTTAAFALAYGLAQLYPKGRAAFVFCAAACGLSRVLGATHLLTDVLAGAWLGWEVAHVAWNSATFRSLCQRLPEFKWLPRADREPCTSSPVGLQVSRI